MDVHPFLLLPDSICYDMCTQRNPYNWSRELYLRHGQTIEDYLKNHVLPSLRQSMSQGGKSILLRELQTRWTNHEIMNTWLRKFFSYLDRFYVKHHSLPTLHQAGLKFFKTHIYEEIKRDATSAILSLINEERKGDIIDKTLVKKTVSLYEAMGITSLESYVEDMEGPLLEATKSYYALKSQEWIATDSTPEYLIKAERALEEEKIRVGEYLHPSTETKLLRVCLEELLEKVEMVLLEKEGSGFMALLANEKSDDLMRMFSLFSRVDNGLNPMANMVEQFIISMGNEVIKQRQARIEGAEKDKNDDPEFIKALLELHEKNLALIRTDFSGHALFQKALKDAFVEIINKSTGSCTNAELMSSYCDRLFKSGEKLNETEVELNLDRVVQLFSYLNDKDLFAEIYRNLLAKRLLDQRSTIDIEKVMIAKLKMQCGTQFTSKMEGMISDLAVGSDMKSDFDSMFSKQNSKLDFSVQVLTAGFWPSYRSPDIAVPEEMTKCMDLFKVWHDPRHAQRKLTWMYSLGGASVRATFGKKVYDIQVTTLQAIALNTFNDGKTFTFEELENTLNLEPEILKPLLHSLSCGKFKVISKTPAGNKINNTDSFVVNSKFTCPTRKFRIPMASLDATHSPKRVEEDRSFLIDACIVRTMKARKTMQHQQLISEVMMQLTLFKPLPRDIKKRIEGLIEREYLERSAESGNVYNVSLNVLTYTFYAAYV